MTFLFTLCIEKDIHNKLINEMCLLLNEQFVLVSTHTVHIQYTYVSSRQGTVCTLPSFRKMDLFQLSTDLHIIHSRLLFLIGCLFTHYVDIHKYPFLIVHT